jgi:hypothetical protein
MAFHICLNKMPRVSVGPTATDEQSICPVTTNKQSMFTRHTYEMARSFAIISHNNKTHGLLLFMRHQQNDGVPWTYTRDGSNTNRRPLLSWPVAPVSSNEHEGISKMPLQYDASFSELAPLPMNSQTVRVTPAQAI